MSAVTPRESVYPQELEAMKNYYNRSNFFLRLLLMPSLLGASIEGSMTPLAFFTHINTSYFQFMLNVINFFSSEPLDFFSSPRVEAWQALQEQGLLTDDMDLKDSDASVVVHESSDVVEEARTVSHVSGASTPVKDTTQVQEKPKIATRPQNLEQDLEQDLKQNPGQDPEQAAEVLEEQDLETVVGEMSEMSERSEMSDSLDLDEAEEEIEAEEHEVVMNTLIRQQGHAQRFLRMERAGLLNPDYPEYAQANRFAVVNHQEPEAVVSVLIKLTRMGLLSPDFPEQAHENRALAVSYQNPRVLLRALLILEPFSTEPAGAAYVQANYVAVARHEHPRAVADVLQRFNYTALLNAGEPGDAQANRDVIVHHQNPLAAAMALDDLYWQGLLSLEDSELVQANRDAVANHPNPEVIAEVLGTLHNDGLLNADTSGDAQAFVCMALSHPDPRPAMRAKYELDRFVRGNPDYPASVRVNFETLLEHQDPDSLQRAVRIFYTFGLLSDQNESQMQANYDAIVGHPNLKDVVRVLEFFVLFTPTEELQVGLERFLSTHQNPVELIYALQILKQLPGTRAQQFALDHEDSAFRLQNYLAVIGHQNPIQVAGILQSLSKHALLDPNHPEQAEINREVIVTHPDPELVKRVLDALDYSFLLNARYPANTQANYEAVVCHQNSIGVMTAFCIIGEHRYFDRLSPEEKQAVFNEVVSSESPLTVLCALGERHGAARRIQSFFRESHQTLSASTEHGAGFNHDDMNDEYAWHSVSTSISS